MRLLSILLVLLGCQAVSLADSSPGESKPASPPAQKPAPQKPESNPSFTREREAAALAFVAAHHPELRGLLDQLKTMQRHEYEKAIRQLFYTSEKLAVVLDQDAAKYSIELEDWKTKSRIQLLVARAGLSEDPQLEKQLREQIERQADLRQSKALLERDRAAEKLRKAEENLTKVKNEREAAIEKQLTDVMRGIEKSREQFKKQSSKSAKKK